MLALAGFTVVALAILWPFYSVPTGSRGVVTQFGKIVGIDLLDIEPIAGHVGDDQRNQQSGSTRPRQAAAFDPADLFSHGIELIDVRSRRAQVPSDRQFVFQGYSFRRCRQQGRSTAR